MADSVDRVFGHALNTVNKIRTGSQKPPVAERLKLYGLYKQAMEGDVEYIQPRPEGSDDDHVRREQDKWDAWHSNSGLSRTAAKKAYIETLVSTMHTYASATPEARELVAELEFVWDQVRNNSNPSGSDRSSPLQAHRSYPGIASAVAAGDELGWQRQQQQQQQQQTPSKQSKQPMRVLSPVSQGEEELEDEREEFVDAPAYSQYEGDDDGGQSAVEGQSEYALSKADRSPEKSRPRRLSSNDISWRKRIEIALIKTTTELAALREQFESRSYIAQRRRHSLFGLILRLSWFLVKLVVVDVFFLWLVILYLRRKKDRRLEGAVRVLLGDAVAQMQKVSSNMKVPKLPIRKS